MIADLRYGVRMLAKSPGATAVAILALGLGIGANSVMFTYVNAIILRPLPFPDLDRVAGLWETAPQNANRLGVAPANFLDWREQSRAFERMAAIRSWPVAFTGNAAPERVEGYQVSPALFPLLGIAPALGRTFTEDEAEAGHDRRAVLSHRFWKGRLAGDPHILGRTLSLAGQAYSVVGVMPRDMDFPLGADLWSPLAFTPAERAERNLRTLRVMARLRAGVSIAQARQEMALVAGRIARQLPQANAATGVAVLRLREVTNLVTDRFMLVLLGAAGFVLLLACANVANLQLARALGRRREMAIRAALGAGRGRIARQLIAENVVLAGAGAVLAAAFAGWSLELLQASIPEQVYKWVAGMRDVRVDGAALAFTAALALLTAFLCGLAPALQAGAGARIGETLKQGGRGVAGDRGRLRSALVVAEVALALVLLVGAGLMVKAFRHMMSFDAGYNPHRLLTLRVSLPEAQYRETSRVRTYYDQALQRLAALPHVNAAAAAGGWSSLTQLAVDGRPAPPPGEPLPDVAFVSDGYFAAMGIPLLRGRPVAARDDANAPAVAVVSQSVAQRYWRTGEDPIGSRLRTSAAPAALTVIGIAGDTRDWFQGTPEPQIYLSARQWPKRSMELLLRTHGEPLDAAAAARDQILGVDRQQAIYDVKTMDQRLAEQTSGVLAAARMMSAFGLIAMVLAAAGIYALISYSVAQRTQEIGVRLALGASRLSLFRLVVGQALKLAVIGLAAGLPCAFALSRLASSAVYGVLALDPAVFIGFTLLLAVAAALAGYLPARQAAAVDPVVTLRYE